MPTDDYDNQDDNNKMKPKDLFISLLVRPSFFFLFFFTCVCVSLSPHLSGRSVLFRFGVARRLVFHENVAPHL